MGQAWVAKRSENCGRGEIIRAGRRQQALAALEQVRRGEPDVVRGDVLDLQSQGVHQEALAALRLFAEAATKEEATAELARRVAGYLAKARCQPGLWFEGEAAAS